MLFLAYGGQIRCLISVACLSLFVSVGFAQDSESIPQYDFDLSSSHAEYSAQLETVLTLDNKSGKLKLDDDKFNSETFQTAARGVAGLRGSSSSSRNGGQWSKTLRGRKLKVVAGTGSLPRTFGRRDKESERRFWEIEELAGSQLATKVFTNGNRLGVEVVDRNGVHAFRFAQSVDGSVRVVDLSPECQFVGRASSFDEFVKTYPKYFEKRLLNLFAIAGLGMPPNRFHPRVAMIVLKRIQPEDKVRNAEFKKRIAGLSADRFEEREAATKEVENTYSDWQDEIQAALSDNSFSPEVRSRLKKIHRSKQTKKLVAIDDWAAESKLEKDVGFLIWLMSRLSVENPDSLRIKQIESIGIQLEKLTEQSFGSNLQKWQQWNKSDDVAVSEPKELPRVKTSALLADKSTLDDVAEILSGLLQVRMNENSQLAIDRKQWKTAFDGRSLQEVFADIRKDLKKRGLPEDWFLPGGQRFTPDSIDYPQLVFQRVREKVKAGQNRVRRGMPQGMIMRTANRSFSGTVSAELTVHDNNMVRGFHGPGIQRMGGIQRIGQPGGLGAGLPKLEQKFFRFKMSDQKSKQFFSVSDDRRGNFSLIVSFPESNSEIRFVQHAGPDKDGNQVYLFDLRGDHLNVLKAKDFTQLLANNELTWEKEVLPLLRKFGFRFGTKSEK